jgi:hypothetical protein
MFQGVYLATSLLETVYDSESQTPYSVLFLPILLGIYYSCQGGLFVKSANLCIEINERMGIFSLPIPGK